ncbi:MAG: hypothetical protein AB7U05_08820 [Mangrovibacterium sp.]
MKTLKIKILNNKAEKILDALVELNLVKVIKETEPESIVVKVPVPTGNEYSRNISQNFNNNAPKATSMEEMRNIINAVRNKK